MFKHIVIIVGCMVISSCVIPGGSICQSWKSEGNSPDHCKEFKFKGIDIPISVFPINENMIGVAGTTNLPGLAAGSGEAFVISLSKDLKVNWKTTFHFSGDFLKSSSTNVSFAVSNPDTKSIFLIGSTLIYKNYENIRHNWIAEVGFDGRLIRKIIINEAGAIAISITNKSEIILIGRFSNVSWIGKYSRNFNPIWIKYLPEIPWKQYIILNSVLSLKSGEIIVAGDDLDKGLELIKYNSDGKEIWRKSGYGRIQLDPVVIRATPSGSFIITTTSEHNLMKPTVGYTQILTIKIDNGGDMIWKNLYGKKAHSHDIIERNQGYVVCGNSYETDLFEGKSVGLIIRMNSDGKIENERRIGGSDLNICKGLLISNNRLYIVGQSTYEESGNSMVKIFIIIDETN